MKTEDYQRISDKGNESGYIQEGYTQDDLMAFIDEKIIQDQKGEKRLLFVLEDE